MSAEAETDAPGVGSYEVEHGVLPPWAVQRRREPRYLAIEHRIWMQWWEDDECLGRCAELVNISRHGAMMVLSVVLREGQSVRIYIEHQTPQIGVSATVLGFVEGLRGLHQCRLGFRGPCPDAFFEAAAGGVESLLVGNLPLD